MHDKPLKAGDLVRICSGETGVVINIWEFEDIGSFVATMVDGDVRVFPSHEITKIGLACDES